MTTSLVVGYEARHKQRGHEFKSLGFKLYINNFFMYLFHKLQCSSLKRPKLFEKEVVDDLFEKGFFVSDGHGRHDVGVRQERVCKDCCCSNQGDQIWRYSTTLANDYKSLAIYLRLIWFWAKFSTHFGTIYLILGAFSLLKMAKYWKHNLVIWSHWSQITVPNLRCVLSKNSTTGGS